MSTRQKKLAIYINPNGEQRREILRDIAGAGLRLIGIDGTSWNPETEGGR